MLFYVSGKMRQIKNYFTFDIADYTSDFLVKLISLDSGIVVLIEGVLLSDIVQFNSRCAMGKFIRNIKQFCNKISSFVWFSNKRNIKERESIKRTDKPEILHIRS